MWIVIIGVIRGHGRWCRYRYRNGVQLKLIQSGKPMQYAYIESLNGRFWDECLNEHWLTSLVETRVLVAAWRRDFNEKPAQCAEL